MHLRREWAGGCTPRSISATGGAPQRRRWAEGRGAALTGAARARRAAPNSVRPTAAGSAARSAAGARSSCAGRVALRRTRHAGGLAAALALPCQQLEQ
jgi:hypothetical protein